VHCLKPSSSRGSAVPRLSPLAPRPSPLTYLTLFLVATLVAVIARRLNVPYTVALVVTGLGLGGLHLATPEPLTKELLFGAFLPGLLFEAAIHLEMDDVHRNRVAMLTLAFPGVAAAAGLTALLLAPALGLAGLSLGWASALVFATLISATDPIAVVAMFRTLGAPKRLSVLVEGESLLNDGTAVVFFGLALALASGTAPTAGGLLARLVYQTGAGALIGLAVGAAGAWAVVRVRDPMLEIMLTTLVAYGSFSLGEHAGASGVIATVVAGLACGTRARAMGLSAESRATLSTFWEYIAFALNSLVFLLIGFRVPLGALARAWREVLLAFVVVTVARFAVTAATAALLPARERLPRGWTALVSWSGLRGGLSMVLALSLPISLEGRESIVTMTFGVVVLSIVVQGLTIAPLLRRMGLAGERMASGEWRMASGE
jgi:CPA1 family monovalent cation:H+ antiporter